jgi:hypothetical protein
MHHLIGHAIVSADDCIADATGRIPAALHNEEDWVLFQAALDQSALTLIGRTSHEMVPNQRRRRRLIVSSNAVGLERRTDGFWLNPVVIPLEEALNQLLPDGGDVAVVGGQGVFDLVGASRFAAFHLARARRLRLPGGRGLFRDCERGVPAASILSDGGLVAEAERIIDPDADVSMTVWSRRTGEKLTQDRL